jgi:ABC-type branched-subunit amino acid transport system substrate-binding protein
MVGSIAPFGEDRITAVLQPAGIPGIGDNALADWLGAPNEFPILLFTPSVFADFAACSKLGLKKVGIAGTDNAFGESFTTFLLNSAKKLGNVQVVTGNNRVIVGSTATDVSPQAQQLISSGAQCIDITGVFPQQQILLLKALDALGAKTKVVFGTAGVSPKDLAQVAPLAEKYAIGTSMFPGLPGRSQYKTIRQFISELKAEAKSGDSDTPNVSGNAAVRDEDFQSWIAVHAAATVMAQEKAYTAQALMAALQNGKSYNLGDLLPSWNPTATGTKLFPRLPVSTYYVIGYKAAGDTLDSKLLFKKPIDARPYSD